MKIADVEGYRTVEIDCNQGSIFITCGEVCIELDKLSFLQGLKDEFGMVFDWDMQRLQAA